MEPSVRRPRLQSACNETLHTAFEALCVASMGTIVRGIPFGDPATPLSELVGTLKEMHDNAIKTGSYGFAKISEDLKDALVEVQPILEFSGELLAKAAIPASVRVVDTPDGLQCWTSSDASVPELLQINGSKKTRLAHAWNARFAPLHVLWRLLREPSPNPCGKQVLSLFADGSGDRTKAEEAWERGIWNTVQYMVSRIKVQAQMSGLPSPLEVPGWCFNCVHGSKLTVTLDGVENSSGNTFRIPDGTKRVTIQSDGRTEIEFVLND